MFYEVRLLLLVSTMLVGSFWEGVSEIVADSTKAIVRLFFKDANEWVELHQQ
jgi:hypothetical protein